MRDLQAEAAGDINAGQTHRLNRIAQGYIPDRRDSVLGFGPSGRLDRNTNQELPPARPTDFRPPNGHGPLDDKQKLAIAKAAAASFKASGGKDGERENRRAGKDGHVNLDYGPSPYAGRSSRSPRAVVHPGSLPRQDARATLPAVKLPARLPGPSIRLPPGARKARQVSGLLLVSAPQFDALTTALPQAQGPSVERRAQVARQQPFRLSTPEEYLKSVEASAGLRKSKHAPPQATLPASASTKPTTNGSSTMKSSSPMSKPVENGFVNTAELHHTEPSKQAPGKATGAGSGGKESTLDLQPATPSAQASSKAMSRSPATPSLAAGSGTEPSPITRSEREPSIDGDLYAALELLSDAKATMAGLETSFAEVKEEWLAGADDDEFGETSAKRYLREAIHEDNTVTGGPYYLAAIIAYIPRIADPKLGS